jgi:pyridoxine 4-dehydrogenase
MGKVNQRIQVGEREVLRLGLGTNRISDNPESRAVLRAALDFGVNFIDTADKYGISQNIIGATLSPYPKNLIIATKGGWSDDNDKSSLEAQIDNSLKVLKVDQIYLWYLHRVDPTIPIEQTMEFLKSQVEAGKIRHIGLSGVTIDQIKAARKIVPILAVQNRYNLVEREDDDVIDYCEREGIIFAPFFPLNSGSVALNKRLQEIADKHQASPIQIAIAWLLKRSPTMLPIPGTLDPHHLRENLKALDIDLTDKDYNYLSQGD